MQPSYSACTPSTSTIAAAGCGSTEASVSAKTTEAVLALALIRRIGLAPVVAFTLPSP